MPRVERHNLFTVSNLWQMKEELRPNYLIKRVPKKNRQKKKYLVAVYLTTLKTLCFTLPSGRAHSCFFTEGFSANLGMFCCQEPTTHDIFLNLKIEISYFQYVVWNSRSMFLLNRDLRFPDVCIFIIIYFIFIPLSTFACFVGFKEFHG